MTASETLLTVAGPAMALILVGSALARRRLPPRKLLTLAGAWIIIILLAWAAATLSTALHNSFT